jgi:nicotinamide riboside kinase
VQLEDVAQRRAHAWVIVDTSPLTTLFCLDQFGHPAAALQDLAVRRYDVRLLCEPDIPFFSGGCPAQPGVPPATIRVVSAAAARTRMPYDGVAGTEALRLQQALAILAEPVDGRPTGQ